MLWDVLGWRSKRCLGFEFIERCSAEQDPSLGCDGRECSKHVRSGSYRVILLARDVCHRFDLQRGKLVSPWHDGLGHRPAVRCSLDGSA
ncbi:hypothetical protein PoB_006226300 [Plakobranchus ocellatus]|uniref:Uncharacterized protein n=1 Tax=Plakobranchus ocellatus TaxID=259542 RepID=A0AAV4CV31_9GAST|nr:hypothetical protein PoB_006226300 [Plakobranchus ocellatus]